MNKKSNGFTFLEVIVCIFLIGIFFIPAYSKIMNSKRALDMIRKKSYGANNSKNILESLSNSIDFHGINFLYDLEQKETTTNLLLQNLDLNINQYNDFLYNVSIKNIFDNKEIIFTDSILDYSPNEISVASNFPNLFVKKNIDYDKYDIVIEEKENKFNFIKGNKFIECKNKEVKIICEEETSDINILISSYSFEEFNFLIKSNQNIYLTLLTKKNIKTFDNINYIGEKTLFANIDKAFKEDNYIITVEVFDKNSKFITRLGTLK